MNHTFKTLLYLLYWGICYFSQTIDLQAQTNTHQTEPLPFSEEKSLGEVLKQLEQAYHKTILFTYDEVRNYRAKQPSTQNSLSDCLDSLFCILPFEYTDKGEYIVIKKQDIKTTSSPSSTRYISGYITDMQEHPIEAALVWLVSLDKKHCISQTISADNGAFSLPFPDHPTLLMITCLGYNPYTSNVLERPDELSKHIRLTANIQQIDNVVVIGQKIRPIIEQKGGKLIFNVSNTIHAQGENALEILRQTPGVLINDASKSIALHGRSGVLIMLNGKQTYMEQSEVMDLLKSTPSTHIQSIEIMNNATAQYDAAGSGGILNIILKRPDQKGYNMQINTGLAYWLNPKQNTEISFNYNHKKWNMYGSYSHILGYTSLFYGSSRKQNGQLIETQSDDTDKRNFASGNVGIDYELHPQHHIGAQISGNFAFGPGFIRTQNQVYDSFDKPTLLYRIYSESENYHQVANRYTANLNYSYTVPDHRNLTMDIDYSLFKGDLRNRQPNTYYHSDGTELSTEDYQSFGNRNIHLYAATLNYKENLHSKGELTTGLKYSDVSSDNDYNLYQNTKQQTQILDTEASNRFNYRESILSAFLMYDISLKKNWLLNMGCRMEYTHSKGVLYPVSGSTAQYSEVEKNYIDFFPSASITYQIGKNQSLSLSYGKRIDRPVYSDLNPIDQPLDGLSSWRGNPFLSPQYTHRFSLEYQYKKTIIETSYSVTHNYRVQITDTLSDNKIVMIPRNLGKQTYYGLSITQNLRFFHAWDLMLYGRAYYLDNKMAFDEKRFYHRQKWAYECSLQSNFPLCWGIKGEILGSYTSPRLGSSTDVMAQTGQINIGFQKKFWQDKAMVKLSVSDIFWTSNWDNTNTFDGFEQISYGYGESRMIKINFTFKFGGSRKHHVKESYIDTELNRF